MKNSRAAFFVLLLAAVVFLYWKYRVPHKVKFEGLVLKNQQQTISATSLFQNKVTVVSFFASWCPPCIQELPTFAALRDSFADSHDFQIVCITDEPYEKYAHIVQRYGAKLIFLQSAASREQLNIPTIPTNYIITKNGEAVYEKVGEEQWNSTARVAYISALLR